MEKTTCDKVHEQEKTNIFLFYLKCIRQKAMCEKYSRLISVKPSVSCLDFMDNMKPLKDF